MELFLNNISAYEASKQNGFSYKSVWEYYQSFRAQCVYICEEEYEKIRHKSCQYEEYFYIEKSKQNKQGAVFEAKNFLTFDYHNHTYTILLPSLKRYKNQFIDDGLGDMYTHEIKKFARDAKIIRIDTLQNNITRFWEYFERHIVLYKGVEEEHFGMFLKEFEFKYNHTYKEALHF